MTVCMPRDKMLCIHTHLPCISMPNLRFLASTVPEILGGSKCQNWVTWPPHDPFWPNFADVGYFSPFSICVSNLTRIASSMTDIWQFHDFSDLAAKCLFVQFLKVFFRFWPLKLWNYCFDPNVLTSRGDTRFEMRVKIHWAVLSVALFKY